MRAQSLCLGYWSDASTVSASRLPTPTMVKFQDPKNKEDRKSFQREKTDYRQRISNKTSHQQCKTLKENRVMPSNFCGKVISNVEVYILIKQLRGQSKDMFNMQSLQVFISHAPFIRKVLKDQRESLNQTKGLHGIQETGGKGHLQDDEVSSHSLLLYWVQRIIRSVWCWQEGSGRHGSKKMKSIEYLVCLNESRVDSDSRELWLNGRRWWERKGGEGGIIQ